MFLVENIFYFKNPGEFGCIQIEKNMKKPVLFFMIMLNGFILNVYAQEKPDKTGLDPGFITGFTYGYYLPAGDLSDRFGSNFKISIAPSYYFHNSNFFVGIEGSYIFGSEVKEDIISNLLLYDGNVVGIDKSFVTPILYERGVLAGVNAGKIIPFGSHKRTGLKLELGIQKWWHWIHFQKERDQIPQLEGEYKKGYDRLTGGFAVKGFAGYQYLARKSRINFYIGMETYAGFTSNLRRYNYNTASVEDKRRNDIMTGVVAGWILPLYIVKHPEEIYY